MVPTHPKLDSVSIITLLGTEFIISNASDTFFLLVLETLIKSIILKDDFVGHCSIYS